MAKRLSELTVTELKAELENRELEPSGKKSELIERLKVAQESEGWHPDTFLFKDETSTL